MERAQQKQLGAFYTPPKVARFVADWAIRNRLDRVLEPSCGDAEFLLAAAERFDFLDRSLFRDPISLTGIDVNATAVASAIDRLAANGVDADLRVGDFFDLDGGQKYDAVIGNPPYIRYHQFAGSMRAKALRAASK